MYIHMYVLSLATHNAVRFVSMPCRSVSYKVFSISQKPHGLLESFKTLSNPFMTYVCEWHGLFDFVSLVVRENERSRTGKPIWGGHFLRGAHTSISCVRLSDDRQNNSRRLIFSDWKRELREEVICHLCVCVNSSARAWWHHACVFTSLTARCEETSSV